MASLDSWVKGQMRKGSSRQQIRKELRRKGYSSNIIEHLDVLQRSPVLYRAQPFLWAGGILFLAVALLVLVVPLIENYSSIPEPAGPGIVTLQGQDVKSIGSVLVSAPDYEIVVVRGALQRYTDSEVQLLVDGTAYLIPSSKDIVLTRQESPSRLVLVAAQNFASLDPVEVRYETRAEAVEVLALVS